MESQIEKKRVGGKIQKTSNPTNPNFHGDKRLDLNYRCTKVQNQPKWLHQFFILVTFKTFHFLIFANADVH